MDEESVLNFLTSLEALDLPDRIEEVNSKILHKIIEDSDYVAVLFCEFFNKYIYSAQWPDNYSANAIFHANMRKKISSRY